MVKQIDPIPFATRYFKYCSATVRARSARSPKRLCRNGPTKRITRTVTPRARTSIVPTLPGVRFLTAKFHCTVR